MKTERAELKRRARQALRGHYGTAIGGLLLYFVVYGLLFGAFEVALFFMIVAGGFVGQASGILNSVAGQEGAFIAALIFIVLLFGVMISIVYMMIPGLMRMHMNICKGEPASAMDIFWALKHKPMKFLGISLVLLLIAIVCMIPSMILSSAALITTNRTVPMLFHSVYMVILYVAGIYASLTFSMFYFILVEDPEKGWIEALMESRRMMIGNRLRFLGLSFSFLGWMCLGMMSFGIGLLWLTPYMTCTTVYFYLDLQPKIETIPPQTAWNPYMEGFNEKVDEQVVEESL